ncbi:hypothetical protein SAMN05216386_1007 [Nitrosospira briensis]|uniref:RiboL-PSP-HEPN domain-containing protein n=1 Tax=Nitrosospira briensis TaxID=35799 RepID=A0A1I4Z4F7_9PROT|nr:hypothetical protein [Nitrosospira briensis]SFN44760.1 hypothetical protein SAMN05216386_1007 [Nitrosospira briensis]
MTTEHVSPKQIKSFRRFFEKLLHGKDFTLIILRCHLLLEEQIRAIVDERLVNPTSLSEACLECHQWICLAEALCPADVEPILWKSAKKLNKLRNDIAHKLDPQGLNERVADFVNGFPSGIEDPNDSLQERFEKSLLSLFILMTALTEKDIIELL